MAILSKFVQNVTTVLYSNAGAFLLLYKYFLFQLPFFVDFQSGLTHTIKSTLHPEEHIGYKHSQATFLSKITFFWLTPLIWHGYQNPLEFDDLGALHESDTCRTQYDRFHFIYNSFKVRFIYYYHYLLVYNNILTSLLLLLMVDSVRCAYKKVISIRRATIDTFHLKQICYD